MSSTQRLTLPLASDPNYHKYEDLLSPGWVPGRKIVRQHVRDRRGAKADMF